MSCGAYYNEIDPFAAQWLRNLIAANLIAQGDVDERSIVDVRADDLRSYAQCHFFAGIGCWSYALRLAEWPDDEPVWTGSCPCQPFSAAGRSGGFDDSRHLWPHWARLIGECRPVAIFGEQVASADGLAWLDFVCADLEAAGYAIGAVDTCAAGFGAPHIRQRLFFVADAQRDGTGQNAVAAKQGGNRQNDWLSRGSDPHLCGARELADADGRDASAEGVQRGREYGQQQENGSVDRFELGDASGARCEGNGLQPLRPGWNRVRALECPAGSGAANVVGNTESDGRLEGQSEPTRKQGRYLLGGPGGDGVLGDPERAGSQGCERSGDVELHRGAGENGSAPAAGFWRDAEWLACIDGKARPVEPGTFPLAHGATARVGRLRAYGNAIVAPVAAEFIRAYRGLAR